MLAVEQATLQLQADQKSADRKQGRIERDDLVRELRLGS